MTMYHLCDLLSEEFLSVPRNEYAIALGNFDGMHLGHQNVIATAVSDAKDIGCKSAVVTFYPHPSQVISQHPSRNGNKNFEEILSLEQKITLMKDIGIDEIFVIKFTHALSELSPEDFIELLHSKFNVKSIVTGYNFRFGHNRSGSVKTIHYLSSKYGFTFHIIHKICVSHNHISSSWLRIALKAGCVQLFSKLTCRNYFAEGLLNQKIQFGIENNSYKGYLGYLSNSTLLPTGAYLCSVGSANFLILLLDAQTISQLLNIENNHNDVFLLLNIEKNYFPDYHDSFDIKSKVTMTVNCFLKPYTNLNKNIQEWIGSSLKAAAYLVKN